MVLGLGTDLIEIARIKASVERFGERFLRRVFTPGEIAFCMARGKTSAESLAARFAAKEAAAKALGTGIARGVSWTEMEVHRLPGRAPEMRLHGRAAERAERLGVRRIALSLTHGREHALAVVILEDGR
ncbi:MAG: holo-ACP synthase [Acidobacteriota bacterium]|nr:holo-ACP synthase [Acidobacteriota bacterium]